MNSVTEAFLAHTRPRLAFTLKLLFSEAQTFGQPSLWLGSVIQLVQPLGFQERAIRTAVFRLAEHQLIEVERHGRRSLCMLTAAAASTLQEARQRLNYPPARSFAEDWTMLINSGGMGAARYAAARLQLLQQDFCQLAPNVLARPAAYERSAPGSLHIGELRGLARFEVSGGQLAAAVRQPLFGKTGWVLSEAATDYAQFQRRFGAWRPLLAQAGAISDEQAFHLRLLVSQGYQHCRLSDPLLPQELLPESWPAMAAYQTYMSIYAGCAPQAQRYLLNAQEHTSCNN